MDPAPLALLALETSGNSLGVALCLDGRIVFEQNVTEGMIHGRALIPLMQSALASHHLKPAELAALAVSQGPGSWTGLRIGIAAAKAFAWAARIPLVPVPSFEALAADARVLSPNSATLTLRDARSEGFFTALFDAHGQRLIAERVLKPAEVVEAANRFCTGPLSICGDEKCLTLLAADINANNWTPLPALQHIAAQSVALCGWRRIQANDGVLKSPAQIHTFGPLYLRASDPELKLIRPT